MNFLVTGGAGFIGSNLREQLLRSGSKFWLLAPVFVRVHSWNMQLTLPEAVERKLSPRDAALHLAIGMFVSEETTLGQAAEIAGLTQSAFLKELGARHIPMHYGTEEFAEDLKVIESFKH